jgi:acyl carrier protein
VEEDDGRGLVEQVMDLLGIKEGEIGENENLSGMGIDSMQVVEVRARIQRALGRPFPLEEVMLYVSDQWACPLHHVLLLMCCCVSGVATLFCIHIATRYGLLHNKLQVISQS